MTAIYCVKALNRANQPAFQAFPCISCHLERHSNQINET